MSDAIQIQQLTKTFGRTVALDRFELRVETGQIHGFLGPNGAGKSTTIRILLGLLRADSGTVRMLGGDPFAVAPRLHRRLAYVPGDVNLWPNLTGGEIIDLLGRARGGLDPKRRDQLIEAFELDPHKKGRSYSKGNRQKVALIAALSSEVELLLLDEPTSGLDPLMERVFTDLIREQQHQGRTVLLSSHILSEVDQLCDHVSIIKAGRLVESGSLSDLRHLQRSQITAELAQIPADLATQPGVHDLSVSGNRVRFQLDSQASGAILKLLAANGLTGITATPPTLEEIFVQHYQSSAEDAA